MPLSRASLVRPIQQAELSSFYRVFAKPGDLALVNSELTAVVRKQDGWLTELWRNRPILPTTEQLGVESNIDSLWQFHQIASAQGREHPFIAKVVEARGSGIRIEAFATIGKRRLRAITQIEAGAGEAKIRLKTRFDALDGSPLIESFGDAVRWGNVQYYVSGLAKPRMSYEGPASWVGRHGAQGDLLLRPLGDTKMRVNYRARIRGFQGPIRAYYSSKIPQGNSLEVERELSFEPLPRPTAKPSPASLGTLEAHLVDERGRPIAGKLRLDRQHQKEPLFDEDGGLEGADRFVWTGNGQLKVALPKGHYRVFASAGLERDAATFNVQISPGSTTKLSAELPRVLSTPGWLGADLHLHQVPSVDADVSIAARLVSIAAEGVELAAATDHYVVTDLAPAQRELVQSGVLTTQIQTIPGTEVSTLGNRYGHFNVFPIDPKRNIRFQDTTPAELFADARKQAPEGILQVNHPRMDALISYFEAFSVDKQGNPQRPGYSADFDTIEVYNGDEARDLKLVRRVLHDWLAQLGRGKRYVATGSSDSHKLAILDPGLPRTFIQCADPKTPASLLSDEQDVHADLNSCIRALKAGRAIVTSGPFIRAQVSGFGPGEEAPLSATREFNLELSVEAAPWIDISQVEILAGGTGRRIHFELLKVTHGKVERYKRALKLKLPPDANFIVILAQGSRGLPNVSREFTLPFGFTNPIWFRSAK